MAEFQPRTQPLKRGELRKLLDLLQHHFPTLHPVRVVRPATIDGTDKAFGDTQVKRIGGKKYLVIRVAGWLPYPADWMVFCHEYAHAMVWRPDHQENDEHHGPEWGLAESKLWKVVGAE